MKALPSLRVIVSLLGLLALPLGGPLFSAPPAAAPEARLRFLILDETSDAYSLQTGGTRRQLNATPYVISRPVAAKPGERLEVFRQSVDPVTGKPRQVRVASVSPPAGLTAGLVVLTPRPPPVDDPAAPPVYGVDFFDSDPGTFPPGSIRILNLGRAAMGAQFGATQVVTPPGESRVVQPTTDERNRVFSKIAVQTAAGWNLLSNRVTILRPDERLTGVFVYSPSGLRHTYTRQELAERGPPPPGHFWLTFADTL
ncbi:MAG: hypothetical protein ABII82_10800 [Verrucomicrobiota bacterium]